MKKTILLIFAVILAVGCLAVEFPVVIEASDPSIRYTGRFTEDYRFGWSGSRIEIETDATDAAGVLELVSGSSAGMTVVVDGKERFLKVIAGQTVYPLATDLQPGQPHHIELFKRSEGSKGTVRFKGFQLSEDAQGLPTATRELKLLVIGDSITCGYANEAVSVKEGNTVENENGYMAYAPIAARELNADLMMVCWSGRGMYRNRQKNNDTAEPIPVLFDRTLPESKNPQWDHSRFIPDVVVINLGTNDKSTNGGKPPLRKDDFVGAYTAFIEKIRNIAPNSKIILSIGPMAYDPINLWLPEIAAQFDDASTLIYARPAGDQDLGGHWHPSVRKHKKMATELVSEIKKVTAEK